MNIDNCKKFLINLERRKDRLEHAQAEFDYMGWEFDRFNAVDTGDFKGCARSHMQIAQQAIDEDLDYYLVFEDDVFFMPYTKKIINEYIELLSEKDWDMFHFGPAFHRTANHPNLKLIHLNNDMPAASADERGIYCTQAMLIKKTLYKEILRWPKVFKGWENYKEMMPIDLFFDKYIYKNYNCYCPNLPLATQIADYSNINRGVFNVHYTITYNWAAYVNKDLPNHFFHVDECRRARK